MSTKEKTEDLLRQLNKEAKTWIEKELPNRMEAVGASKEDVLKQLETEAEHWVQYNVDQRSLGKDGSPSPDFHIKEGRHPVHGLQRGGRPLGPDPD